MVKFLLRIEGLFIFLTCLFFYYNLYGTLLFFVLLFLIPDVSMAGYLINKKLGAFFYNCVHNYILPSLLVIGGFFFGQMLLIYFGLILGAHVGLDRFFGFGLKYKTHFRDTHLQKV